MRSRALWMLLLALVAGVAAVLLAARWMQQQGGEKARIAVASTDIALGARVTPDMVRMAEWPRSSVPEGAFTDANVLDGRVVVTELHRGEPVLQARLAPVGSKGGLAAVVPDGKRAMTVRVNDVVGVGGFVLPGTYVDIMVNVPESNARNDSERSVSKIVLERLLVLAVAQEANRDETKPKVVNAVTLEVSPEQAEVLDLARSVGSLSLVLRNQTDPAPVRTAGATKAMLLGLPAMAASAPAMPALSSGTAAAAPRRVVARRSPAPQAAPAAPKGECIEVIRGVAKTTECF